MFTFVIISELFFPQFYHNDVSITVPVIYFTAFMISSLIFIFYTSVISIFVVFPRPCLYRCTWYSSPWQKAANIFDCQNQSFDNFPATVLQETDWLLLSGNNLRSLNKAPDYLKNITLLILSSSNITEIDETVMEDIVENVQGFDIRGNQLKTLPKTITKANKTKKMWISKNPYECNCDMLWMKDWLMETGHVMDKENVTCSGSTVKGEVNYLS